MYWLCRLCKVSGLVLWDEVPFLFGPHIQNSSKAHPYIQIFSGNKICNDHVIMHYIGYIEVFSRI